MEMKRLFFPVQKGETVGDIASAVITTNAVDRQGEIVEPDGIDLANYLANPIVLYGHCYSGLESIPVGRATSLEIVHEGDKKSLKAQWQWQADDVTPLISAVRKSWERGFLNTVSIGFMPGEYDGNTIKTSQLLEFSVVPVPANPQALRLNGFTDDEVKALTPEVTAETLIADLESMVSVKEGRVLSAKNYDLVSQCIDSLTALRDAADKTTSGDVEPKAESWLEALHKQLTKTQEV
jgi:phage head maturation protease